MAKKPRDFDAVAMMREARDRISRDLQEMTFEEQKVYLREHAEQARKKLEGSSASGRRTDSESRRAS